MERNKIIAVIEDGMLRSVWWNRKAHPKLMFELIDLDCEPGRINEVEELEREKE